MAYDFSGLSVIVADDDSFILQLTRSLLNGFGISKIKIISNSNALLDELASSHVDILIVDWDMDPMNGIDITRFIRMSEESTNRYLPIIFLTGNTEMSMVIAARDAGVNEFLAKPMTVNSLYQRIVSVIERPRPFVRSSNYFGPDRRRNNDPNYAKEERRASEDEDIDI